MAVVALDDSDPKAAIAIGLFLELQAREAEGAFYGTVVSEVDVQNSLTVGDSLLSKRRRKWVAKPGRP